MVTPRYLPEIGGVERHVHEVATRIAASGEAAVTVLTTVRDGRRESFDRDGEVEVRRVAAHPRGRDWMFAPAIVPVIADGGWDVVHVQSYHTLVAPLAMATAARRRIPYVVTFHGGGHSQRIRNEARRGSVRCCVRCSCVPPGSSRSLRSRSTPTRRSCGSDASGSC